MATSSHAKFGKIPIKNREKVAHINFSDKLELEDIMKTLCHGKGIQLTYISADGLMLTLNLILKR